MLASIRTLLWRLLHLTHRTKSEASFDSELEFHLRMEIEESLRQGMTPVEARRHALIALGGVEQAREEYREARKIRLLDELRQDFSYGLRSLKRNPGFAAVAILTLGAALGASAVMFSIINSVLLLPLPYKDADRLVHVYSISNTGKRNDIKAVDFIAMRRQSHSFESLAAIEHQYDVTLSDREFPELIDVMAVSADFFDVMDARAAVGRVFQVQDFDPSRKYDHDNLFDGSVAVLSYRFWQSRYGGDHNLIGQTVRMNGKPVLVIGVAAPEFQFSDTVKRPDADCWVPRVFGEHESSRYVTAIGKIRKNTSIKQAQAEIDTIAGGRTSAGREKTNSSNRVELVSLHESVVGQVRLQLLILCGAVIIVLLIACSNIANLLMVRAAGRQKEMALRSSIGASRRRLIRQVLAESILLCLLGGIAGILIAVSGKNVVVGLAPGDLPKVDMISIDLRSFGFTLFVAVLTGVLCGIVPALRASGTDLTRALKQGTPGYSPHCHNWLASCLITGQIAMALVLLIASGLMLRTYIKLQGVPLNFEAKNVLIINATPPEFKSEYRNAGLAGRVKYIESLLMQLKKIGGVENAAVGSLPIPTKTLSFSTYGPMVRLYPEGQEARDLLFNTISVSPDYFIVIRARLLAGRRPGSNGRSDNGDFAVVNEAFARQIWPDTSPIGKNLILRRSDMTESIEVGGLIADVRTAGLERDPVPQAYIPLAQSPGIFSGSMLVRTTVDPLRVVPLLRKALIAVDKDAALGKIELLEQVLDSQYAPRRFNLFIISLFGVLAFSLAVIGIFGTIAHSVSKRTHEIGIRMALGAQRASVLALIVREGIWMLVIGEAIGLTGAFALNKLLSSMVFEIATTDAATYIVVSLTWAAVALLACFLPAYRATKTNALLALRCE